jgi:hypothetical protein
LGGITDIIGGFESDLEGGIDALGLIREDIKGQRPVYAQLRARPRNSGVVVGGLKKPSLHWVVSAGLKNLLVVSEPVS